MIPQKYKKISEYLEERIRTCHWTGRIPGVMRLASEIGVHHVTISKAIRILVEKGILEIRGTAGTFVLENGKSERPKYHVIAIVGLNMESRQNRQFFSKLNDIAKVDGYGVVGITYDEKLFQDNPKLLLNFPVDGFVFRGSSLHLAQLKPLLKADIPIVSCARQDQYPDLNQADCNHEEGYSLLLQKLKNLGHSRIAFLSFNRGEEYQFYLNNIRKIFQKQLGENYDSDLFYVSNTERQLYQNYGEEYRDFYAAKALKSLLNYPRPPTAVVVSDGLEQSVFDFLKMTGRKVPEDLALVSVRFKEEMVNPFFSGVCYEESRLIIWTLHRLLELLHKKNPEVLHYFLSPTFISGETIGTFHYSI